MSGHLSHEAQVLTIRTIYIQLYFYPLYEITAVCSYNTIILFHNSSKILFHNSSKFPDIHPVIYIWFQSMEDLKGELFLIHDVRDLNVFNG